MSWYPPSYYDSPSANPIPDETAPSYKPKENVQEYHIEIGMDPAETTGETLEPTEVFGAEMEMAETTEATVAVTTPPVEKKADNPLSGALFLGIALIVGMLFLFAKPKRDDDED